MTMQIDRPSRFWTLIGKLAVIVGLVVGISQVWHLIFPKKNDSSWPHVVGTLQKIEFRLPPDLVAQITAVRKLGERAVADEYIEEKAASLFASLFTAISMSVERFLADNKAVKGSLEFDAFSKFLKKDPESAEELRQRLKREIAGFMSDFARSTWTDDYKYRVREYSSYVILKVDNDGDRQASNVELTLPYKGIASVEIEGDEPRIKRFENKVIVGNILPKGSATVRLWTDTGISAYSWETERWRLSYAEGIGVINFPVERP